MAKMIATRGFSYDRRDIKPDEEFETESEGDVVVLIAAGFAKRIEEHAPTRRQYKRRDLAAEE